MTRICLSRYLKLRPSIKLSDQLESTVLFNQITVSVLLEPTANSNKFFLLKSGIETVHRPKRTDTIDIIFNLPTAKHWLMYSAILL